MRNFIRWKDADGKRVGIHIDRIDRYEYDE
jgi:hypothetical protein